MKKIYLTVSLGMLALLLLSCSGGKTEETAQETPQPPPTETPPTPETQPVAPESGTVQEALEPPPTVSGLLPQTNPQQRRSGIIPGRDDPFALIPVEPKVQEKTDGTGPASNVGSSEALTPPPPPEPNMEENSDVVEEKPPVLEADLAKQVVITGVIDLGGVTQIIINAPNEPYTRYVQIGQYVSNGQVLVKRVEMGSGANPIVVLEQSGIEVFKSVGASAAEAEATQTSLPGV